jgi:hypothetical protein
LLYVEQQRFWRRLLLDNHSDYHPVLLLRQRQQLRVRLQLWLQ